MQVDLVRGMLKNAPDRPREHGWTTYLQQDVVWEVFGGWC